MRMIRVSDKVYQKLSSIKGKKSFTELLSELASRLKQKKSEDILKFAGIMSQEEADEVERMTKRIRQNAMARI